MVNNQDARRWLPNTQPVLQCMRDPLRTWQNDTAGCQGMGMSKSRTSYSWTWSVVPRRDVMVVSTRSAPSGSTL